MYNLLRFIKIYHFLLLFLLIEGFSVLLLVKKNRYQASKFVEFSTQYTSLAYNYTTSFSDYLKLQETNKYLINENAKLHSMLKNEIEFTDSTTLKNKHYDYYPAKVINSSVSKRNNFITLNKGMKHGIKLGMGVITNQGIIGVIHSVSKNYAIAISLLNQKSAIGIQLNKNNHNGILEWKGFNYRIVNINNFPNHIPIRIGDTISSNSHSIIFPEGVNIGSVNSILKKDDGFYDVSVQLFEDFNKLNYVYIVHSRENTEQLMLEERITQHE